MSADIGSGRSRARSLPFQACLIALILLTGVPAFVVAGVAIWQGAESQRLLSEQRLLDTAHTVAQGVEGELENHATLLRTVVAGLAIDRANEAQGSALLREAGLGDRSRVHVEAIDPGSSSWPEFTPMGVPRTVVQETLRTGAPAVSNLFQRPSTPEPRIALAIAQGLSSARPRILSLILPPEQLLRSARPDPTNPLNLLVAVTDGTGRIIARSRDAARAIGHPVPDWHKLQALQASEGVFEATTTEGRQVMLAYRKLRNTPGWVLVVGEPIADFEARWAAPLRQLMISASFVMAVALALAVWLGRRIVLPMQDLDRHARHVARGGSGRNILEAAEPLPIREFESLRQALKSSEEFLRRTAALERVNAAMLTTSERRYRSLAEVGASCLWRADANRAVTNAAGWEKLTGEDESTALGFGWLELIHPADRHLIDATARRDADSLDHVDVECRLRDLRREWRWVRIRAASIRDDGGRITEWVGVIEDVDDRRRDQARIAHMATHDALTGLPNRAKFWERLSEAVARARRGDLAAVLSIDLDRFKQVNDTLGHPTGDALLQGVTFRLNSLVRDTDTVARMGGDEFMVVQSQVRLPSDAADLAVRIIHALSQPFEIGAHAIQIGASVGVVLMAADSDAETLVQHADVALYRAKSLGRGRHVVFDSSAIPAE